MKYHNLKNVNFFLKKGTKHKKNNNFTIHENLPYFVLRMETGWATSVVKPILKIRNVINRC